MAPGTEMGVGQSLWHHVIGEILYHPHQDQNILSYILRCGISHLLAYTQSKGSSISHCSKPKRVNSGKFVLETIRDHNKLLTCSSFNLSSYSPIMLNPYLSAIELPQGASLSRAADKAALTPMVAERESAKRASRVCRAQDFALHRPILKHKV